MDTKWQNWLDHAPLIGMHQDAALDERLREFAMDTEKKAVLFASMKQGQRKYIHNRCEQLGLKSTSGEVIAKQSGLKTIKNLKVEKPEGWNMPWDQPKEFVVPSKSKKARVPSLVECDNCGHVCEGLYHWSGMGPLCEECIEADEEWSGHKWEPRSW
jgi:hypothetical protein